jgi:hypothetical protein
MTAEAINNRRVADSMVSLFDQDDRTPERLNLKIERPARRLREKET